VKKGLASGIPITKIGGEGYEGSSLCKAYGGGGVRNILSGLDWKKKKGNNKRERGGKGNKERLFLYNPKMLGGSAQLEDLKRARPGVRLSKGETAQIRKKASRNNTVVIGRKYFPNKEKKRRG